MIVDKKSLFIGIIFIIILITVFDFFNFHGILAGIIGGICGMNIGIVVRNAIFK